MNTGNVFPASIYELAHFVFMPAAMETEVPKVPARKKEPSKRTAAQKKPLVTVLEVSGDDDDDDDDKNNSDDEDFDLEAVAAQESGKKGGRKPAANAKAAKAPVAAKKREAPKKQQPKTLGQKLVTDMLKPAANSMFSPEKKVRKMRESPFNKKSGSVLGKVGGENEATGSEPSTSASTEETVEVAPARARPQRVNRKQTRYVLSDSESENSPVDTDFDEKEED